jgi:hypothetical protein
LASATTVTATAAFGFNRLDRLKCFSFKNNVPTDILAQFLTSGVVPLPVNTVKQ